MKRLVSVAACLAIGLCGASGDWSLVRVVPEPEPQPAPTLPRWSGGEADTNRIDLLLVFDAAARRWLDERDTACEDCAKGCVDDLNASLAHTGIDRHFTFRLAGVLDLSPSADFGDFELSDVVASFSSSLAVRRLDGQVVERVRQERDERRADVVAILTLGKTPNIYGYAHALTEGDLAGGLEAAAEQAYCACRIDSLASRHVLLHEVGHLFGAGHSEAQHKSPGPALFPYSSAYRFPAGATPLTTVAGYPSEKDGSILPFFSSPDYLLTFADDGGAVTRGIPVGTASNDNTRTLIATYPLVAQYRAARPTDAAARFERNLAFSLSEGGRAVGEAAAITLRAGVRRAFAVEGVDDGVQVAVSHLPPGFALAADGRSLSGRATRKGEYTTTFAFSGDADGLTVRRRVVFRVEQLPSWAMGGFATEDAQRRIDVSETGSIRLQTRRAYRAEKTAQDGFLREDTDDSGCPAFVFEDGKRLARSVGDDGRAWGVVTAPDGTVYLPDGKRGSRPRSARRHGHSTDKTPSNRKTHKENTP